MLVTLARAVILYILIIFCMRIMGKRQLGELQPTELVITILLSEIAAIPMQDNALPLGNSIVAVMLLVALEIINSYISLKSSKMRSILQGNSLVIIREGKIDRKQMSRLRFSMDDLLDQLRQKNIFDIEDVRYAVIETNGQLSVMLKPEKEPVTADMISFDNHEKGLMCMVMNDGKFVKNAMREAKISRQEIEDILKNNKISKENVLFMLADSNGNISIETKEEEN